MIFAEPFREIGYRMRVLFSKLILESGAELFPDE
jgi:hypothetical protein